EHAVELRAVLGGVDGAEGGIRERGQGAGQELLRGGRGAPSHEVGEAARGGEQAQRTVLCRLVELSARGGDEKGQELERLVLGEHHRRFHLTAPPSFATRRIAQAQGPVHAELGGRAGARRAVRPRTSAVPRESIGLVKREAATGGRRR